MMGNLERRNARCFENVENSIEQIKLNRIFIPCIWYNFQIWPNDHVSIIYVLDSL